MNSIKNIYQFIAVTLLSVFILFLIINYLIIVFNSKNGHRDLARYFFEEVIQMDAYLNSDLNIKVDTTYIKEVIENHCQFINEGEYRYYPNIEYTLHQFKSKHINILQEDLDLPNRLTLPKGNYTSNPISIYCFGGSTTYGDFVSDQHTWPSFLSDQLQNENTIVKNYGCHAYTPTSETHLFIELIKLGHRPSLVIFLDGINLGPEYDASLLSKNIDEKYSKKNNLSDLLENIPLLQILNAKTNRLQKPANKIQLPVNLPADNQIIINRFIENARIRNTIAKAYNIQVLNILQPNTLKEYNDEKFTGLAKQVFSFDNSRVRNNVQLIYKKITDSDAGYLDMSDLFKKFNNHAIVDIYHYSPSFNQFVSSEIRKHIDLQRLNPHGFSDSLSTGKLFISQ